MFLLLLCPLRAVADEEAAELEEQAKRESQPKPKQKGKQQR
jgi:hypothetical protein